MKSTRVDYDIRASISDENLFPILVQYCRWAIPFSAVCTFEVNKASCNVVNIS